MMHPSIRFATMMGLAVAVTFGGLFSELAAAETEPLDAGFQRPPIAFQPRVFWFWMGKNVSREGITADLDAMREVGIGGLIHMAIPDSVGSWDRFEMANSPTPDLLTLSAKWWDLMAFAVSEAGRRDMFFDLHVCPGWATAGGPWITPENSMQILAFSRAEVDGSAPKPVTLKRPPIQQIPCRFYNNLIYDTKGFYRDVGVVAVPKSTDHGQPDLTQGVDISSHMKTDGTLAWSPPTPDTWIVYRIGHHSSGRCIHPCTVESFGLEANKWCAKAMEINYRAFAGKLIGMLDADGRKALRCVHIDSYEAGPQNWTETFREDFRQRRGYDPLPFLPLLSANEKEIKDERALRFLDDFRRTENELLGERLMGNTAKLAHQDGLLFSCEPYGHGMKTPEMLPYVDIPMDEFWVRPSRDRVAMPALYAGKNLVGAEAFTSMPEYPDAKMAAVPMTFIPRAHSVFAHGVNMLYFHSYAHQPFPDHVKPGMIMGQWGTQINRKLTWWRQSRPFFEYIARCQFLLQQGVRVADALDMQYCPSSVFLNDLEVRNGRIHIPNGNSFAWIQLTNSRSMRPSIARRLRELVAAGAVVVGPKPNDAPGLEGYPASVEEVQAIADELWGNCDGKQLRQHQYGRGTVLWNEEPAKIIPDYVPDFVVQQTPQGARFEMIHRHMPEADIYFVANTGPTSSRAVFQFRATGRQPELFNAADGTIRPAESWLGGKQQTEVALRLKGYHATFVVFRKPAAGPGPGIQPTAMAAEPTGPVIKAPYGLLGTKRIVDVRDRLNRMIADGQMHLLVGHALGIDPAPYKVKDLHITYKTDDGQTKLIVAKDGDTITLPQPKIPSLLELDGPWDVTFPPNWGAPQEVTLPELIDLSEHENSGIQYFSGTAVYRKGFSISQDQLDEIHSPIDLDLGSVCHVVTVKLNGHDVGILWRPPYRIDVTKSLRAGRNQLALAVTNTWVNRLIGDQQEPDDCTWYPEQIWRDQNIGAPLKAFPGWFADYLKTGKRPSQGRYLFVFWSKYTKDSPLPPSGLIGPAALRTKANR